MERSRVIEVTGGGGIHSKSMRGPRLLPWKWRLTSIRRHPSIAKCASRLFSFHDSLNTFHSNMFHYETFNIWRRWNVSCLRHKEIIKAKWSFRGVVHNERLCNKSFVYSYITLDMHFHFSSHRIWSQTIVHRENLLISFEQENYLLMGFKGIALFTLFILRGLISLFSLISLSLRS